MSKDTYTALAALLIILGLSVVALSFDGTPQTFASHTAITEDESYDEEIGDYTEWVRRYSSSLRRKIDRLDDGPVDEFEIPILFGVTLEDITPNFGDPRGGGTRLHEGLDMLAPLGTPVISPTEAVVVRTGRGSSAGNYVYTANPGDETFVYMHLDAIADIESGDVLDPGELIGFVGDTGNANGVSHLHFEVRKDRGASDPYPRIQKEYGLEEKMEILSDILDDMRDEDELAEFLVETFGGIFLLAEGRNIELHKTIEEALEEVGLSASIDDIVRDLSLGDEGSDVVKLQTFLITLGSGPAATKLADAGATGYFGPVTESALIEYQRALGITPASGVFGALTRAKIQSGAGITSAGSTTGGAGVTPSRPATLGLIATLIPQDLSLGAEGASVRILQLFLILRQSGPASRELFAAGATGYFGPLTSAAFSEYQNANSIPQSGVYDARTRLYIKTNE